MIGHEPDASLKRIRGCWKRSTSFAAAGPVDPGHPLAPAWSNCLMFLDARAQGPRPKKDKKQWSHDHRAALDGAFDISCLDWMALKIEAYAKEHVLSGDATVAAILHEWRDRMPFDPTRLSPA